MLNFFHVIAMKVIIIIVVVVFIVDVFAIIAGHDIKVHEDFSTGQVAQNIYLP